MVKNKRNIFIAATGQHVGKTTNSVGLYSKLVKHNIKTGFIKPVGQRYVQVGDIKIDEDSYLISKVFKLSTPLQHMNPVTVPRGFTEEYIRDPQPNKVMQKIIDSFNYVQENNDFVVIEGTGHAGVGSVIDNSNADVAKVLNSKVILVTNAGIGNSIDQLILNKALFDKKGVEVLGVIVNKVREEKYEKIKEIVGLGLNRLNIKLLGVIPYQKKLESPNMGQLCNLVKGQFLEGKLYQNNTIQNIIVGAMSVGHILSHIVEDTLIITPGDREDIILAAISQNLSRQDPQKCVKGIIITGDISPSIEVIRIIKNSKIPIIICELDTFTCASNVHDLTVKIQVEDEKKLELSQSLFDEYVDYEYIMENC